MQCSYKRLSPLCCPGEYHWSLRTQDWIIHGPNTPSVIFCNPPLYAAADSLGSQREDCGQGHTKHVVPVSVAVVVLCSWPVRCARHKLSVEDHCVMWPLACSGKVVVRWITQASISILGGTRSVCALLGQPVKLESTILPVSSVPLLLLAPGTHVKLDLSAGGGPNSVK
jgi:hypothetical protein